ncbi:MAG: hypothetical protein HY851_03860 [candidate division Zixibacteria bacterium]|nr:hypothetical protein [candidate division Zixibacteria bacterium]
MKHTHFICKRAALAVTLVLLLSSVTVASGGSASIRVGYTFNDDTGSMAVNQPTYNTYEGLGLSLSDVHYRWDNGTYLTADLRNITMNNRNVRAWIGKPGRFSLSATNDQYRRVYDWSGGDFTRRRNTSVQGMYQPSRYFKFFGGYGRTDKHGTTSFFLPALSDSIVSRGDWSQTRYNVGGQVGDKHGLVKVEYRRFDITDHTAMAADRKADQVDVTATSAVPGFRQIFLAGGLNYRKDIIETSITELSTNQYWGAGKFYFTPTLLLDYRLVFATTKRNSPSQEIDNLQNTVTLAKSWGRWGGIRAGYESRIIDDILSRTISNGVLTNVWARPTSRLYLSGLFATRKADAETSLTVLGDENRTRGGATIRYSHPDWGTIGARWEGRFRRNNELNSSVDYNVASGDLNLERARYGRLSVSYSYYMGTYENRSDVTSYKFRDHVLSGHVYPVAYRNLTFDAGGTWYRSRRDQDIEKFNLDFGASYRFPKGHRLEVRYNVFNYDDYHFIDKYYTANIVEISFIKDVQF